METNTTGGTEVLEASPRQLTVITADCQDEHYWLDVWRHRELAVFLAWRDLVVRYKQTVIGVAWTLLRPLASILVYTMVFGIIARLPSEGVPYSLLVLTGLLPWQLFSLVLIVSSESLTSNSALINKVYFPRIIIPFSSIVVCVVDHFIAFGLIFAMLFWYGMMPQWQIILLPLVTILAALTALGFGLTAAALNTKYRDIRHLIPIVIQLGMFVCPVAYATSLLPEKWQWVYALNPVVGIIDAFRWCILGKPDLIFPPSIFISLGMSAVFFVIGIVLFRRQESTLADVM